MAAMRRISVRDHHPEDYDLIEALGSGTVAFNADMHSVSLRRLWTQLAGIEKLAIEESDAVLLIAVNKALNKATGTAILEMEDADSSAKVAAILLNALARCGSPRHRQLLLGTAQDCAHKRKALLPIKLV